MRNQKAVFLFGAGALLDWEGPSTADLTDLIRKTGFKTSAGERITEVIYQMLCKRVASKNEINFESIINTLEELFNYSSTINNANARDPSSDPFENSPNIIKNLFYFIAGLPNEKTHLYSLSVPGFESRTDNFIPDSIPPEQKYCEWLLDELLSGIIGHVSKYSYYTSGHQGVIYNNKNRINNEMFCTWMESFTTNDYSIRMYTLNYDRVFKILLQNKKMDIFEGFDTQSAFVNYGDYLLPNIPRIVTDFNCHVYYNLHGSAYWHLKDLNNNDLPGYQYFLTSGPNIEIPRHSAVIEIEKGRKILLTNIITGYQKAQRTALSPFRQMLSAFDRDCIEADEIFIIGYSYGDEHINDIIRNARKFNPKCKITLINPSFDDEKIMFAFLLHWGSVNSIIYENKGDEIFSPQFNLRVIQKKFSDFLCDVTKSDIQKES